MKRVSIVSDSDIYHSHGVNYVTNTFLQGKDILQNRNYELYRFYDPSKYLECDKIESLPQFANKDKERNVLNKAKKSSIKEGLKSFINNVLFLELIKYYFVIYRRAKKTVKFFIENDNNQSDIVIFQGYLSAYIAYRYYSKKIRFKSVCIMHTGCHALDQMPYSYPAIAKCRHAMEKLNNMVKYSLKSVNHLVILSQLAKQSFDYIDESKKTIIYNGILEKDAYPRKQVNDGKVKLICVASLQERKGQHLLIEALSKLPKVYKEKITLNLVGSGNLEYYKALAKKYKVSENVEFFGNRSDIPELLSLNDIFILASFGEGLPISIIEAMREGLYIMTTAVGGCPDMINTEMGTIIPLDPDGIAGKIIEVIDSEEYIHCSLESIARYEQMFTLPVMINKYADLFDKIS